MNGYTCEIYYETLDNTAKWRTTECGELNEIVRMIMVECYIIKTNGYQVTKILVERSE